MMWFCAYNIDDGSLQKVSDSVKIQNCCAKQKKKKQVIVG